MIFKKDIKENSLEEVFLKPLDSLKRVPVSPENMEVLMLLTFKSMIPGAIEDIFQKMKSKSWQLEALEKRVHLCLTVEIEKSILIWLTIMTNGNIGQMVSYAYYLQYWGKRNNVAIITWDTLHQKIFPMGYFESNAFLEVWDKQKIRRENSEDSDNLIDYPEAVQSIQL